MILQGHKEKIVLKCYGTTTYEYHPRLNHPVSEKDLVYIILSKLLKRGTLGNINITIFVSYLDLIYMY